MLQISNKDQRKLEKQRQSFGNYLRSIRIDTGLPIKDFAVIAGFSRPTISQYETGKIIPTLRNLDKLCSSLAEVGVEQYKLEVLKQKHEDSLKASPGSVIGSVLHS